jgi:catechol 2,3-dioxygenase-like lactoylglutathione lyase family enzyme
MSFTGIDAVVYGVANMEKCRAYFTDWGLKKISGGKTKAVFETRDGSEIVLRPRGAKDLPKAIQPGSTVREIVWGVTSKADLARVEKELSKDRAVTVDKDGTVHSTDDLGLGIAFRQTRRKKLKDTRQPMNSVAGPGRVNARATYHKNAQPSHIGHCVFMAPDIKKMEAFYTQRLGFTVSDYYTGRGVFIRAAKRGGHHNLFFLEAADGKPAINHVAFGVDDIHELFAGGAYFQGKKHKVAVGPGRHHVSSCYFWYFDCPAGGATEYFCDEDFLTEDWKPGHWDPAPETFAEWMLADGIQRKNVLPPTREKRDTKLKQKKNVRERADARG